MIMEIDIEEFKSKMNDVMEWCVCEIPNNHNFTIHINNVKECVHEFILKHTLDEIKFETLINTENFDTTIRMTYGISSMEKTTLEFIFRISSKY